MSMRWLGLVLLAWTGCHEAEPRIKPPSHPEYILPPADDARFSSPPNYPKETLDAGQFQKEQQKPLGDSSKDAQRFGGPGGGMGGRGGMGGMGGGY
jgi:hypothetical protein